ncbi:MAG: hypothetical protein IPK26_31335 [Planctomycetes bacterium]|nr:hypothetical protein [Planctomycetota bacterium]
MTLRLTILLGLAVGCPSQVPSFGTGNLDSLTCKVSSLEPTSEGWQTMVVEVTNRGPLAAEPLEFEIVLRERKVDPPRTETFRRVSLPLVARYGRPAPANGRQTYTLTTALPGKKGAFDVRVIAASWYGNGDVPKPEVKISEPKGVQRTSLAGSFPVTEVSFTNPFDRELDVLCLVTLTQPVDVVDLMGFRLPAKATTPFVIATRPGPRCFLERDEAPGCAMKATNFRIVDWSLVGEVAADAGEKLLQPAYDAWYRWPTPAGELSGRFAFTERRLRLNSQTEYDEFTATGRYTVPADGAIRIAIESGKDATVALLLEEAFAQVRRPDFAALRQKNQLVPIAQDRVEIRGPGWRNGTGAQVSATGGKVGESEDVQVVGERITSTGRGDGARETWHSEVRGRAWLVTRRTSKFATWTFAYTELGGLVLPRACTFTQLLGSTNPYSIAELRLTEPTPSGRDAVRPEPPIGDGVAALRTAWDAAWHVPTTAIAWSADFEVTTGKGEDIWRGQKKFSGSLQAIGIGRNLRELQCTFAGKLAPELQTHLTAALADRFNIWWLRDPNDRLPFDEFFAGAKVAAADAGGTFAIEHGPVASVAVGDGLVRGWRTAFGLEHRFHYQAVGGRQVVTKVTIEHSGAKSTERWTETVLVGFQPVGELLLPASLRFERIYGKDWGPEVITLTNIRLR